MAAQVEIEDIIKDEEEERFFLKLFGEALDRKNAGESSDYEIAESIQEFVDYFKENRKPAGACAAGRFQTQADFLGYFYWHSPLSAAVTRNKVLKAIRHCEEFRSCINQSSLKIVSVGSGNGSDLVGLYSAVNGNSTFKDLEVVLIDNIDAWETYFHVINELLSRGEFGDASRLVLSRGLTTSFICYDLTSNREMIPECDKALGEANLVWMKGFLSTLSGDFERYQVCKKIISSMSSRSLLVVMESLAYDQFHEFVSENKLRRLFNTNNGFALEPVSEPRHRIMRSTTQEIIIFERI